MPPKPSTCYFPRLSWPSALVAERACTALGGLLIHPAHSVETEEALFKWLGEQKLETVACHALLVVKQVQIRGGEMRRSMLERLAATAALVPLLAAIWWNSLTAVAPAGLDDRLLRTGPLGARVRPRAPQVHEQLPSRLCITGNGANGSNSGKTSLSCGSGTSKNSKFSIGSLSSLPDESLKFRRSETQPRHAILDLPLGEVYRSGFRRALAWAHHEHGLDRDLALRPAASLCPLDFGLWRIRPAGRPDWWPAPMAIDGPLDVAPARIGPRSKRELIPSIDQGDAQCMDPDASAGAHPGGRGDVRPERLGNFPALRRPEAPEPETLADWCASLEALLWEGLIHAFYGRAGRRFVRRRRDTTARRLAGRAGGFPDQAQRVSALAVVATEASGLAPFAVALPQTPSTSGTPRRVLKRPWTPAR